MRPLVAPIVFFALSLVAGCTSGRSREPARLASAPAPGGSGPSLGLGSASGPLTVKLLAFNDFHGHVRPPTGKVPGVEGEVGGAAYLATHLAKLGAGKPGTFVVAAGDLVGGSPLTSALFHDEPTVLAMNAMRLDVLALGNHELDEGLPELIRLVKGGCHPTDGCQLGSTFDGARFPVISANTLDAKTKEPVLPPYVVKEVEGVPIAFVGIILAGAPRVVSPIGVAGLMFADEVKTMNALVPELKRRGVETIVLLIHEGGTVKGGGLDECHDLHGAIVDIAKRLDPAVDVIVSGHTHALYNCRVDGRLVTSSLSFGRVVTEIELTIDRKTKDVTASRAQQFAVTHDVTPDADVQAIVDHAAKLAAPRENKVVGRVRATIRAASGENGESPLGDIVADAQLAATKKQGAVIALMNTGGLRADIVFPKAEGEPEDGLVTHGEAFASQPFGNTLVTVTMTGAEVMSLMERELKHGSPLQVSEGVKVKWTGVHDGARVLEARLRGADIGAMPSVRLTVNSFLAETDPGLRIARDRVTGVADLEALEAWIAASKGIEPPKERRLERVR